MTHGNAKGQWVKNETNANIKAQITKLEQQVKYCQDKIKWYEEELDRREQEVPLGVPLKDIVRAIVFDTYKFGFTSENSRFLFSKRLNEYVKFLQQLAKGEPFDIQVLLPLLKKGWVAYCPISRSWFWTNEIPRRTSDTWETALGTVTILSWIGGFNLKPAENWETSLQECGI